MSARPAVVWVPQHFGAMVFDRGTSRYHPFDHESAALLRASVDTSWFDLAAREDDPARREALWRMHDDFAVLGWFTLDGRLSGSVVDRDDVPDDHLLGPLAVHLEVVAACNLACAHCFAGELPRRDRPLTLAELDVLFAQLARAGSFRLGLTGGEPLLRKDLLDVIDLALGHGLHPCLTTNALLLDERWARELGRRELVWLNVSLDGATAATNDAVRGDGVFDRVRERLELLRRHARFTLAFTVTRANAGEALRCAELAAEVGASTAVFRPLYPVGVARAHMELMPTWSQYVGALESLAGCAPGDLRSVERFGPAQREATRAHVVDDHGCGAGHTVCSISVGGDLNPCSFLGAGFDVGNVRDAPFERLWREAEGMRRMRRPAAFQGGCRARSLHYAGDVDAPDPWLASRGDEAPHPLVVLRTSRARTSTS